MLKTTNSEGVGWISEKITDCEHLEGKCLIKCLAAWARVSSPQCILKMYLSAVLQGL